MLNLLFGCRHRPITRPITPVHTAGTPAETYVVCLDCGKQFPYDVANMCIKTKRIAPTFGMTQTTRATSDRTTQVPFRPEDIPNNA
jgi:hypothetical protein